MLKLRVPAVIAAVLLMSSVSARAMEFADRPGLALVSSLPTPRAMATDDYSRRQIDRYNIRLPITDAGKKLADRPRPVSNLMRSRMAQFMFEDRPGRLSAEFSTVAERSGIRFEYGPGEVASWLKPTATSLAMKFEDRPGRISNRFTTLAAVGTKIAGRRGFTSSLAKTEPPFGLHVRPSSVEFCVGSIAPCGPVSFAQRTERRDS